MTKDQTRQAICECGQLVVTLRGEPEHHHACTCTKCQRASGSVMTVSAWYPRHQLVSVKGRTMTWRTGGKGTEIYRCARCGGGGYFLSGSYLPHCIAVNVGHFADPDYPPPAHIHWWPSRPNWLSAPADVDLLQGDE